LRLYSGYLISMLTGKAFQWGMPAFISIEPTVRCNLKCPACHTGMNSLTRSDKDLDLDIFRSAIGQLSKYTCSLLLYFQGEPFLHPGIFEMIRYAKGKKIFIATSTNGHFLGEENARKIVESGIDLITISVDGTTQDIYEQYRREGNLEKVKNGIKTLTGIRKQARKTSPFIEIQFLVLKHNEHQMEEMTRLARELGADRVKFKSAQFYDFEKGHPMIPSKDQYSRYRKTTAGTWTIKNRFPNHCWRLWSSAVITADGNVVPCCFDKEALYKMGNLKESSFVKIWKSEAYQLFRSRILQNRKKIPICTNCSEGLVL
jgi:radical SAM protein with 4Fe4S-binding SPASM domain